MSHQKLDYYHNYLPTDKGAWFPGEKVLYREKALFDDFNDKPWMALLIYGVRGKMPSSQECILGEHIWKVCTSFPDPRLWNNRVAALAGSSRSTGNLALAAATAVSEATIYGRNPDIKGSVLLRGLLKCETDNDLEKQVFAHLKKYRVLPGFGRPLISKDERTEPLLRAAEKYGYGDGKNISLVKRISSILKAKRYRLVPNISIYCAALMADFGYSPRDFYHMSLLSFTAGIMPCYVDALEKGEGCFLPVKCNQIEYTGSGKRSLFDE